MGGGKVTVACVVSGCGRAGTRLCDAVVGFVGLTRPRGYATCDAQLCDEHAAIDSGPVFSCGVEGCEVDRLDLCPEHARLLGRPWSSEGGRPRSFADDDDAQAWRERFWAWPRDDRHEDLRAGAIVDESGEVVLPGGWPR